VNPAKSLLKHADNPLNQGSPDQNPDQDWIFSPANLVNPENPDHLCSP
jgi:hypothetical protein